MSNAQKVSDERLAELLAGLEGLDDDLTYQLPGDMRSILTELQSLRAAPTPDAHSEVGVKAEPVAITDEMVERAMMEADRREFHLDDTDARSILTAALASKPEGER